MSQCDPESEKNEEIINEVYNRVDHTMELLRSQYKTKGQIQLKIEEYKAMNLGPEIDKTLV